MKSENNGEQPIFENANCPYCANPDEKGRPLTQTAIMLGHSCGDDTHTLELLQPCHGDDGLRAHYCRIHGTLALFCRTCYELQAVLKIAIGGDIDTSKLATGAGKVMIP